MLPPARLEHRSPTATASSGPWARARSPVFGHHVVDIGTDGWAWSWPRSCTRRCSWRKRPWCELGAWGLSQRGERHRTRTWPYSTIGNALVLRKGSPAMAIFTAKSASSNPFPVPSPWRVAWRARPAARISDLHGGTVCDL